MPLELYKPQRNSQGSAASFTVGSKKGCVFVQIIKQTGWDSTTNRSSFENGAKINLQFKTFEIGAILDAITNVVEYKTVHKFESLTTTITFAPWVNQENQLQGWGLNAFRKREGTDKTESFRLSLNHAETVILVEWLKFALDKIFGAIYSSDKQKAEEYIKKQELAARNVPQEQETVAEPSL